ncbi:MAG TPA: tRNA 4-thiouridine(8) synthase ThiI [Mollicutes bacterium]|nr:tRNA 4-thiouridine(8) synthase ThiI [Mollicutes bacterium]
MEKIILIKYGELSTKKGNRNLFINLLDRNVKKILKGYEIVIKKDRVRMYIMIDNKYIDEVAYKLKKVFGIQSIVLCYKVNTNSEDIQNKVLDILKNENIDQFKTFKIITKRAFKEFPIPSMEFNNIIGGLVLRNTSLKVDVHNPDLKVNIEIRSDGTFIYLNEIEGNGGYPVGVQGKGLLMLSGGIDSPVAGYLALKRGIDLECLYFESPPHTSIMAKNKVIKLANIINEYSGSIKVHVVPFTNLQEEIYKNVDGSYVITIMRRMMYRMAERMLKKLNCKVIINGESVGQVSSQTLDNMIVINEVTNVPVIRPVACMDKLEIIRLAEKINTYETSILPYEDCCTIFLPKHPVINPTLSKCLEYEKRFDYESLISECINNIETISDLNDNDFENVL